MSVDNDRKIVLSLTDFEKSNCFAVSMFDERVFPYVPPSGIQVFRKALVLATTCILFYRMLCSAA